MKKLLLSATAIVFLSTASFAEQNTEPQAKMDGMRHTFMEVTDQMINSQMEMLKIHEAMLSNYQKLVRQMIENDMADKH